VNDQNASPDDFYAESAHVELRRSVVAAAIETFRHRAFHETTLEAVAETAGLPLEAVTAHFPDWNGLLLAAVDRWTAERTSPLLPVMASHGTVLFLRRIVQSNIEDPSLMRLLSSLVNVAATPGHPLSELLQGDWSRFHRMVAEGLRRDVELGREPATMAPARGAEQLLALYEGLQLQSMVRPRMDLLDAYDRAVTRLRDGWGRPYAAPTWDLDDLVLVGAA
jgi:AcrR family transcriptional regulator